MGITLKNLVQTPTFELGSIGGWTATSGTLSVSTERSAFGTKCLKITAAGPGQIIIRAPASPIRKAPNGSNYTSGGNAYFAQNAGNQNATSVMSLGARTLNAGGTQVQQVFQTSYSVGSTLTRYTSNYVHTSTAGAVSIQPVISWNAARAGDSAYIDAVTLVQFLQGDYATEPQGPGNIAGFPDVIGGRPTIGNISFTWEGDAENSFSLATSSATVSVPSTLNRGQSTVITGTGFTAGASVRLDVAADAEGNTYLAGFTTVTADGTGAFSHNWPAVLGDQGTRYLQARAMTGSGWGDISDAVAIRGVPVGPPLKNLFINPSFRASDGTARNLFNVCPNPTPTIDLTGWDPIGAATVTRTTDAKIKGVSHGARVVSAAPTDGIALPHAPIEWTWESPGISAYVRAVTDCTLKISGLPVGGAFATYTRGVGWGEAGWGPEVTYLDGDTITLTAGQVTRARLYIDSFSEPAYPHTLRMGITGTGTYDVDGVWQGMGVQDGEYPPDSGIYPPGTVPFFCGGTPADGDFTYEWIGTPYASASARRGRTAYGVWAPEGWDVGDNEPLGIGTEDYNYSHQVTRGDGETTLALRTKQWFSYETPQLANAAGAWTMADLGLQLGKSYMLSMDVIMDYSAVPSGYSHSGENGNEFWIYFYGSSAQSTQPNIAIPGRARLHSPFNVDDLTGDISMQSTSLGWMLGEVEISKMTLTETTIYALHGGGTWTSPADLTDAGIVPGSDVLVTTYASGPDVDIPVTLEAEVGGVWTELGSVTIAAADWEMTSQFTATVPEGYTGLRLTCPAPADTYGYVISDAPVEYFDGSTPDGDGWSYSWEGEPDVSPSLRSAGATGPTAQVHIGGTAKAVAEMRVATAGGILVPVTQAGG